MGLGMAVILLNPGGNNRFPGPGQQSDIRIRVKYALPGNRDHSKKKEESSTP